MGSRWAKLEFLLDGSGKDPQRERHLYGTGDSTDDIKKTIDHVWRIYEPGLPDALNVISRKPGMVDGLVWAQVLVPFVAVSS